MRRAFTIVAGLAIAIPAAFLTLMVGLVLAFVAHGSGSSLPFLFLDLVPMIAWSEHPGRVLAFLVDAAARVVAVVCCAPVICAALIGWIAEFRRTLWYVLSTAALTVILPMASTGTAEFETVPFSLATGPLLATGIVAGLCYGAIAVAAGRPQPPLAAARPPSSQRQNPSSSSESHPGFRG